MANYQEFILLTGILLIVIYLVNLFIARSMTNYHKIFVQYQVNPIYFKILSTDLGKAKSKCYLANRQVVGSPDVIFKHRLFNRYIIGESKGRLHYQHTRYYEYYQLTLYMGVLRENYKFTKVTGKLCYKDMLNDVSFDKRVYASLLDIAPEISPSLKRGRPINPQPLQNRISIQLPNQQIIY